MFFMLLKAFEQVLDLSIVLIIVSNVFFLQMNNSLNVASPFSDPFKASNEEKVQVRLRFSSFSVSENLSKVFHHDLTSWISEIQGI